MFCNEKYGQVCYILYLQDSVRLQIEYCCHTWADFQNVYTLFLVMHFITPLLFTAETLLVTPYSIAICMTNFLRPLVPPLQTTAKTTFGRHIHIFFVFRSQEGGSTQTAFLPELLHCQTDSR